MARPKKVAETEQQDQSEQQQPETQTTKVTVAPVYGPMHHPFQNLRIEGFTEVEMDSWVEVQIEAGKLTVHGD